MQPLVTALALLVALGAAGTATAVSDEGFELFELFAQCDPMDVKIRDQRHEALPKVDLTTGEITNLVEGRLQAAQLFVPAPKQIPERLQHLGITLHVVGGAFNLLVHLERFVANLGSDERRGLPGYPIVWFRSSTGQHGGDKHFIMGKISQILDEFIAKYLEANEKSCHFR